MSALLLNRLKKQQQRAWEVSRKQLLGAFSVGGIHHLRRPGAKALPERCWSELMVSPPERCPSLRETSHALCCVRYKSKVDNLNDLFSCI